MRFAPGAAQERVSFFSSGKRSKEVGRRSARKRRRSPTGGPARRCSRAFGNRKIPTWRRSAESNKKRGKRKSFGFYQIQLSAVSRNQSLVSSPTFWVRNHSPQPGRKPETYFFRLSYHSKFFLISSGMGSWYGQRGRHSPHSVQSRAFSVTPLTQAISSGFPNRRMTDLIPIMS